MSPNRSLLSLLTILAAVYTVNCGSFSLHFSLPQSSYLLERTLCVNLIGKASCSIAETALREIDESISFDFEGPNRPTVQVSISLVRNSISAWYRRQFSVGFTRFLPIENGSINVTLHCQKNFFGPSCDLHCITDSHKICDIDGQFSCNEGWTGPDCDEKEASSTSSVSSVSTTFLPSTTTVNSPARILKDSNDAKFVYGLYFGIMLLLLSILFMFILLIKIIVKTSKPLESMMKRGSVKNESLSHSPIFYTKNGSNNIDFDVRDTGINNSFNSDEERTYIEIYV